MSNAGIPILGSVTLSGATNIQRKERDYIIEHQIAGKDGGLVERVGSASTRWEIKGFLREVDADANYQSLIGLLGKTSNLSIPTFGSGYFLAASGTIVFVESFQGNWIPGVGYPRYDYTLKLVGVNISGAPGATTVPISYNSNVAIVQQATALFTSGTSKTVTLNGVVAKNVIAISFGARSPTYMVANFPTLSDSQSNAITSLASNGGAGANSAACYAQVAYIASANAGTHTITISTADTIFSGTITIYELSGVQNTVAGNNFSSSITTIALASPLTVAANQLAIGGCASSVNGGAAASFTWSGGGTQGSLNTDDAAPDANFTGITGNRATPAGTQDFGCARQGAGTPNGMAVAGVVFT